MRDLFSWVKTIKEKKVQLTDVAFFRLSRRRRKTEGGAETESGANVTVAQN